MLESISISQIKTAGRVNSTHLRDTRSPVRRCRRKLVKLGCFHLSAMKGHINVASFLLENGVAEVDEVSDDESNTSLHISAITGNVAFARFLVDKGASLNVKNVRGETPSSLAISGNNLDMLKFLIDSGASLLESTHQSWARMEVLSWGNKPITSILREHCRSSLETSKSKSPGEETSSEFS